MLFAFGYISCKKEVAMPVKYIFLTILNSSITITGQVLWKMAVMRTEGYSYKLIVNPLVIFGVLAYGLSTVLWLYILSKIPFSVAYALTSTTYAFSLFAGYYIFHEGITPSKVIGTVLILTGVIFFAKA
jgi:drug/metabolite transporter (DMT)-like permease